MEQLAAALQPYADGTPVYWVQEEPANMGAIAFLRLTFGDALFGRFSMSYLARPATASPASGSASAHRLEQAELLAHAFGEGEQAEETAEHHVREAKVPAG
jgi:2-oxoglutarate dehydrogenase E1 component